MSTLIGLSVSPLFMIDLSGRTTMRSRARRLGFSYARNAGTRSLISVSALSLLQIESFASVFFALVCPKAQDVPLNRQN